MTNLVLHSAKVAGFGLLVRANRFACTSDLSRQAHDTVLETLRQYRAEIGKIIAQRANIARLEDEYERSRLADDLAEIEEVHNDEWCQLVTQLGGYRSADPDGSFINPVTGANGKIAVSIACIEIPDAVLDGLTEILDELAEECSIFFSSTVTYVRPFSLTAEAADSDDDIPW